MAPHYSTPAWKIPWMEEPGRLQSMGLLGVRHNWATSLSLFTFMHWRRKWQPTPVFLPGESQGQGSLVGCRLWGRTESDTTQATYQQQQQQQRPHKEEVRGEAKHKRVLFCTLINWTTTSHISAGKGKQFILWRNWIRLSLHSGQTEAVEDRHFSESSRIRWKSTCWTVRHKPSSFYWALRKQTVRQG